MKLYARDLQPEQQVQTTFLVAAKEVRRGKNGEPYLIVTLADKTGDVEGRLWDNVLEAADGFDAQDFVRVKGAVQLFQNRLQVQLHKIQRADPAEQDLRDYLPSSKRDPDEMESELRAIVAGIGNAHLRALLESFTQDAEMMSKWKLAPAAKTVHHACLGGLLEHTLSMAAIARLTAAHYGDVDLDLLLTGVLLHDVGKTDELSYSRTIQYSTDGQLLGHILIGMRWIDERASRIEGFPPKLLMLLQHMMLSHHGTAEFGSPKPPSFLEAVLLNLIDAMDAKYQAARDHLERDRQLDPLWTGYSHALERSLLRKEEYLSGKPPAAPPPPPAPKPEKRAASPLNSALADKLKNALGS